MQSAQWLKPPDTLRFALVAAILFVLTFIDFVGIRALLSGLPWGIDFLPTWTAARAALRGHPSVYDFAAITRDQAWLLGHFPNPNGIRSLRPWVYPPGAIILLAPLGLASYAVSAGIWAVASVVVNAWAALRSSGRLATVLLAFALPVSALSIIVGQTSLLISGLALLGLVWIEDRPIAAGILFGLVGTLKPQTMVLLPIALVAVRASRPFVVAALTALFLAATATLLFGLNIWLEWVRALAKFQSLVLSSPGMLRNMVSPGGGARILALTPPVVTVVEAAFATLAAVLAWLTFRATRDARVRLVALLGGSLLVSPYALQYDAAMLAVPAAIFLADAKTWPSMATALGGYLMLAAAVVPFAGWIATPLFVIFVTGRTLLTPRAEASTDNGSSGAKA